LGAELNAHRWINVRVTACHFMAGFARYGGDPPHEGTANAKNMNVQT
jgi:hypothetical protein